MRNTYPGFCYLCKKNVEAGDGHFELVRFQSDKSSKWRTIHADCCIKRKESKWLNKYEWSEKDEAYKG